jgi:2-amino-4-hydroxy-6-hydroxymethyldihydropteridine diphosphokinase
VVVAFGSNLGDSASLIGAAMDRIEERSARPLRRSSLWTSTPVDCPPDAPVFINAVAILEPVPGETPESLLAFLQGLEIEAGRRPKVVHNESRPLDLDLIAWSGQIRITPRLILPHPRARERRFVLQPLAELDPGFRFDGSGDSIAALLEHLPLDDRLRVVTPAPVRSAVGSAARG